MDLASLGTVDRRIYETHTLFLGDCGKCRTIKSAAKTVDISREDVRRWQRADKLGFNARFMASQETFTESLEATMFERPAEPTGNCGSDILLIFALKAHNRAKYSDVPVADDDTARENPGRAAENGEAT